MTGFEPRFSISSATANALMRIEAAKEAVGHLPITAGVLVSLRETALLNSTHYSTLIEGNRLTLGQVSKVLINSEHFAGRSRDEREVVGYYAALEKVERLAAEKRAVTEIQIQTLHALVMAGGHKRSRPTPYRSGQNVIRDSPHNKIVYMPPEAADVPLLMRALVAWLGVSQKRNLPCPIRAGIAHYQFAMIHPYYDGNGRTARLLTTLVLHLDGYDLKGIYSLEEYYARDLARYYAALTVGPSHNYYMGRAESDITPWVDYFCAGLAKSYEDVKRRAQEAAGAGAQDHSVILRTLDPRQRRALELFRGSATITSRDVEELFKITQRAARNILSRWVQTGFVIIVDPAKKSRRYSLGPQFLALL